MGYRDYPSKVPADPKEKELFMRKLGLEHLLRVWQWFEVYHLNPYVPPYFSLSAEAYNNKDEEEGGEGGDGFKIITIEKCFQIYDFGDYMATSAGDDYGSLALGQLLRTVDRMMEMLEKRGAEEIAFGKSCIEPAKLYAWQKAMLAGMKVFDYNPTVEDIDRLEHTFGQLGIVMEEIARPD